MMHALAPALDNDIVCPGDSLTEGTSGVTYPWATRYPTVLGTLFSPNRAVDNLGVGGETAADIATRFLAYGTNRQIVVI